MQNFHSYFLSSPQPAGSHKRYYQILADGRDTTPDFTSVLSLRFAKIDTAVTDADSIEATSGSREIVKLSHQMSLRIARYLERAGLIEKDAENSYLAEGALSADEMNEHQVYSVHYRIAVGPQKRKKVFALQSLPPKLDDGEGKELLGKMSGFSLHAGVSAKACDRDKLERLCRYVARPPVSVKRLSLTERGHIRYELKTPYRNGHCH